MDDDRPVFEVSPMRLKRMIYRRVSLTIERTGCVSSTCLLCRYSQRYLYRVRAAHDEQQLSISTVFSLPADLERRSPRDSGFFSFYELDARKTKLPSDCLLSDVPDVESRSFNHGISTGLNFLRAFPSAKLTRPGSKFLTELDVGKISYRN